MTLQATRYQAGRVKCVEGEAFKPTMITSYYRTRQRVFIPSNCLRHKDFTQKYRNEETNIIHFEEVKLVVFCYLCLLLQLYEKRFYYASINVKPAGGRRGIGRDFD